MGPVDTGKIKGAVAGVSRTFTGAGPVSLRMIAGTAAVLVLCCQVAFGYDLRFDVLGGWLR